MVGLTPLAFG